MLLKHLMEEKQLDFNQPLLSVRKFSSTYSIGEADYKRKTENGIPRKPHLYKTELKSGPVRNPGTVPFVWEQSPGRPKYEIKRQTRGRGQQPAAPRLPPGRTLNVDTQALDRVVEDTETRNGLSDEGEIKEKSSREEMDEMDVSGSDDDEAFVDAADTLSRSESFFLNCSVSGVSGLDVPDLIPFSTFLTDQQTRNFMMGRFLPAAKAMASESPQYSTRKPPVAQEQKRLANRLLTVKNKQPFHEGRRLSNIPHCSNCNGIEEIDEENGMKKQFQSPIFPKAQSSYAVCCAETANEVYLQGNSSSPSYHKFFLSAFDEDKGLLGIPERCMDSKAGKPFRELLADESSEWESGFDGPLVEKTLYIDCAHMLKPQVSNSSSSDITESRRDDVGKNGEVEDSSFQTKEHPNGLSESVESADSELFSLSVRSMHDVKIVLTDSPGCDQDFEDGKIEKETKSAKLESCTGLIQDPVKMTRAKVGDNEKINMKSQNRKKLSGEETCKGGFSLLPLPPPLPKSPSESWLKRALPTVSSKHTASKSSLGMNMSPRFQATNVNDTKWETVVKTSNVQQGRLRYSEELLTPIPEV